MNYKYQPEEPGSEPQTYCRTRLDIDRYLDIVTSQVWVHPRHADIQVRKQVLLEAFSSSMLREVTEVTEESSEPRTAP